VKQIVGEDGRVTGVELASGIVIPAQVVIAGIGAQVVRISLAPAGIGIAVVF
jgi:hypothetical protein